MSVLTDRAGLVTGAGSGIGRACAIALADAGAAVLVSDVDDVTASRTAREIVGRGGRAVAHHCDVSDPQAVEAMVRACVDEFGSVDVAVNNAGVVGSQLPIHRYELADWHRVMSVNLTGVFLCLAAELRTMYAQGNGAIVNVASVAALKGTAADAVYTASKHGVAGLTRTTSLEAIRRGVRVNAVCPGVIETGILADAVAANPDVHEKTERLMPIGRFGRPEEIAAAVLWLCSDDASLIVGHLMAVDGGWAAT